MKISASIMCADFCHLEKDIQRLEAAKVDYLHFDIMDGIFVPNFTMGPDMLKAIKRITDIPFDTHLMIEEPYRYIERFVQAGSNIISVHAESSSCLYRTIELIRKCGAGAGVALNPDSSLDMIEDVIDSLDMMLVMTVQPGFSGQRFVESTVPKIRKLRQILEDRNLDIDIEVDGNINKETAPKVLKAGANVLVGGSSSIFKEGVDMKTAVKNLRKSGEKR